MSEPIPRSFIQHVVRQGWNRGETTQAPWVWPPVLKASLAREYPPDVKAEAELAYEEAYLSRNPTLRDYMRRARELESFAWSTGNRWGAELLDSKVLGDALCDTILGVSDTDLAADPLAGEVRKFLVAAYRTARRMRPCGFVVSTPEEAAQLTGVRS